LTVSSFFQDDPSPVKFEDYTVRRPNTSKEEDEFIEAGFEYVRYDEKEECPIYRKRK